MSYEWHWKNYEELSKTKLYQILAARQEVFVVEQDIAYVDCDNKDQHSWHCWATSSENPEKIAAYLRVVKAGFKYKETAIGRVLTTKEHRGKGIGKEIMRFTLDKIAEELGDEPVRISAQGYLEKFYNDFGFESVSDVYIEEGIEHIEMLKG